MSDVDMNPGRFQLENSRLVKKMWNLPQLSQKISYFKISTGSVTKQILLGPFIWTYGCGCGDEGSEWMLNTEPVDYALIIKITVPDKRVG